MIARFALPCRLLVFSLLLLAALPAAGQVCTEVPGSLQCIDCPEEDPLDLAFSCDDNWGLDRLDTLPGFPEDGQYEYPATGAGVHVFLIDFGLHEKPSSFDPDWEDPADPGNVAEFGGRVLDGLDQSYHSGLPGNQKGTDDCSSNSHGTRVASVVGGETYGVAKDVWLHPMRMMHGCTFFEEGLVVSSLRKVIEIVQGGATPAVVNMSFNLRRAEDGSDPESPPGTPQVCEDGEGVDHPMSCHDKIREQIETLVNDLKVTVVVSAGNRFLTPGLFLPGDPRHFVPSDMEEVIVVGGVNRELGLWARHAGDNSYRTECDNPPDGATAEELDMFDCGSNWGPAVDLWAPAELIRGAFNVGQTNAGASSARAVDRTLISRFPDIASDDPRRGVLSGTSFAAPIVAGLAALHLQDHPDATPAQVLAALRDGAVSLGDIDGDGKDDLLVQMPGSGEVPPNTAPDANGDSFAGTQGSIISMFFNELFANDFDADGDSFWVQTFTQPAHGSVRWTNPAGMVYTPDPTFVGQDAFTYIITDGDATSQPATVTLTVTAAAGNLAPIGGADAFVGGQDQTLDLLFATLFANDLDPDGDAYAAYDFTQPAHGEVWTNPAGFGYTPAPGYLGSDGFTYRISDGAAVSAPIAVSVDVRGPNQPPVAADDDFAVSNTRILELYFSLLFANDVDPEGDALEVHDITQPLHGSIRWTNPAGMVYTPPAGYVGPDSLTYTVADPFGATSTATIHIDVMAAPVAVADAVAGPAGAEAQIAYSHLLGNDSGDGLIVDPAAFGTPANGQIDTCCNAASFRYVPDTGFVGTDQFTYTLEDTYLARVTGTVTVQVEDVTAPNAAFTATCTGLSCQLDASASSDDAGVASYSWSFGDGGSGSGVATSRTYASRGTYTVTLTVADAAGNTDTASRQVAVDALPTAAFTVSCWGRTCSFNGSGSGDDGTIVSHAWLFGDGASGSGATATHTYAASGTYTARLTVTDDAGQTATTTRTVGLDLPPSASFTVSCSLLACSFNGSASSDDLGIASFAWSFGDGASGSGVTASRTYATGGSYAVRLTVTDTGGQTASQTKTVTVNRAPVAVADSATTNRDVAVVVPVLANDSDPDGQTVSVSTWTQPAHGSVTAVAGGLRYQPAAGYVGGDGFSYRITDGAALSGWATVSLTVRVPNAAPDARGMQLDVAGGNSASIHYTTIMINDYDTDGHPLSIVSFDTAGLAGTLACDAGVQRCTYTPSWTGYRGVTSFRYTVSDGQGGSDTATVKLKVGVTQNLPVAADDSVATTRGQAVGFSIFTMLANDSDADADVLRVVTSPPRWGTRSCTTPTYSCSYQPGAGFVGFDRVPYTADDTSDGSAAAGVRVLVAPGAPALDAREDLFFTNQNTQRWIGYGLLTSNDFDPQGHPRTVTAIDKAGLNGSLTCDAGGCTYKPGSYFYGTTSFKYTVSDGNGETDTARVTIHVGKPNQAPTILPETLVTPRGVALPFTIFDLTANDLDPEMDPLSVTIYPSTVNGGTLSCSTPAYRCTFTPAAGFVGNASFLYYAGDGLAGATATATIAVQ